MVGAKINKLCPQQIMVSPSYYTSILISHRISPSIMECLLPDTIRLLLGDIIPSPITALDAVRDVLILPELPSVSSQCFPWLLQ